MIDAFTERGIVSGDAHRDQGGLRDTLEAELPVDLDHVTWYPLAGGNAEQRSRVHLECDELLLLCPESQDMPIHASWHWVDLDVGPYRITGELPTLPGFDPGRALARPGGAFVLIREVTVELIGRPDSGRVQRPHAFINRYAVDRVAADIDLGFYFPGAHHLTAAGLPSA